MLETNETKKRVKKTTRPPMEMVTGKEVTNSDEKVESAPPAKVETSLERKNNALRDEIATVKGLLSFALKKFHDAHDRECVAAGACQCGVSEWKAKSEAALQ